MAKCPVCNTEDHICGPPSNNRPQDLNFSYRPTHADDNPAWYEIVINGMKTTMWLSEYDASRHPNAKKIEPPAAADAQPPTPPKKRGRPAKKE